MATATCWRVWLVVGRQKATVAIDNHESYGVPFQAVKRMAFEFH
jgi:hypothetical protein